MSNVISNQPRRFLIGQLARYGDCLYATTIAKQIKKDFPASHITWAIASNFKSILELNPHVDQIWEIPIDNGDYYKENWKAFEKAALTRKKNGEFDEIIFSQVSPLNWINYTGTIRGTILSAYKKSITVPVNPVVILSEAEVDKVKQFAAYHQLERYKNVILFECMPGSGQSNVNPEYVIAIANKIVSNNNETCFILSAQHGKPSDNPQILNAASLSFRENAELTHYCTMLIGCSSGITWIATSEWAKKIPMLQLFSKKPSIYAGVHHDFAINGLDNSHIIEIEDYNIDHVIKVINAMINDDFLQTKVLYHQNNVPGYRDFKKIVKELVRQRYTFSDIISFVKAYKKSSVEDGAPLHINYNLFQIQLRFMQFGQLLSKAIKPIKKKVKFKR